MHRAPAVNFLVSRSRWHLGLVVLTSLFALATAVAFLSTSHELDWRSEALAVTAVVCSAWAFRGWQKSPSGSLRWDGQCWYWSLFADGQACQLALVADLQRVMLVVLRHDTQRTLWLWLEPFPGDVRWLPLRRAVVSSQVRVEDEMRSVRPDTGQGGS
jgi:hypothetical protein